MNKFESKKEDEPGIILGLLLISIIVVLLIGSLATGVESGPIKPGFGSVLVGIYIMAWGVMFLASYFFSHKTFFFRALIWICENFSAPKGRRMAFFYFALTFILGSLAILKGLGIIE